LGVGADAVGATFRKERLRITSKKTPVEPPNLPEIKT